MFEELPCHLQNEEEYLCGRHTELPAAFSKDNTHAIAVPMDCGDFSNRFYLLAVKDNSVKDALYIEGEWQEPGSDLG